MLIGGGICSDVLGGRERSIVRSVAAEAIWQETLAGTDAMVRPVLPRTH
jgi:hypothetical protein